MLLDRQSHGEHGVVAVVVAILLPVLLGMAGLVTDGGELVLARWRLQNAADAAALAAAALIGRARVERPTTSPALWRSRLEQAAWTIARRNWAADSAFALDLQTGRWDGTAHRLVPSRDGEDAVAVRLRSSVPTHLSGVLGLARWTLSAHAVAALPPLGSVPAGSVWLPVGLSRRTNPSGSLGPSRRSGSGSELCLAWLSFSSSDLSVADAFPGGAPALWVGRSRVRVVELGSQLEKNLSALYRTGLVPGAERLAVIPMLETDLCPVPPGWHRVAGFVTARVRFPAPGAPGSRLVPRRGGTARSAAGDSNRLAFDLTIVADQVALGRGGGQDLGTKASSPTLVK